MRILIIAERRVKLEGKAVPLARLGFLINPIAGMGGAAGLRGTDGARTLREAIRKGAKRTAPLRAKEYLTILSTLGTSFSLLTAPGTMGANTAKPLGIPHQALGRIGRKTTANDTARISRLMKSRKVDLLVFCGGDGTARDINKAVGPGLPVLGVPAGVKVYSSVFAINPRAAAETTHQFLNQAIPTRTGEVLDIDEKEYRQNRLSVKLYGTMQTPDAGPLVQDPKSPSRASEGEEMEAIADYFKEHINPDHIYILGPGSTIEKIAQRLGVKKTLLGVDIVKGDGKVLGRDVDERRLLRLVRPGSTHIVVSPIGGTGFILGRGNQQISPRVLQKIGPENITIVAARTKIERLDPRRLLVDTGNDEIDRKLRGFRRVLTGYNEEMVVKVE